jgi:hypothetical protein
VLGTVVGPDGAPLSGADISFFDAALYGPGRAARVPRPAQRARTGPDGRFAFPAPDPERRYGVQVFAPGFVPKGRDQTPGIDAPFELVPAASLAGRVLGSDAARAEVLFRGARWVDGALDEGWQAAGDGAGGYAAGPLPAGRACELAIKPRGAPPFALSVMLERPGELRYDVVLPDTAWTELRVVHAFSGAPVAGAAASLEWRGERVELGCSDAGGWMRVPLQAGVARAAAPQERVALRGLMVHAPGMLATLAPWPGEDDAPRAPDVRLVPSARLRATVLSPSGEPVAGAEVRWISPLTVLDPQAGTLANGPGSLRAVTGPDGRCELADVLWDEPGAAAGVWIDGELRRTVYGVAPEAPGTAHEVELRLLGSPSLAGWVGLPDARQRAHAAPRSPADAPQAAAPPAARVARVRAARPPGADAREARCDASGAFLLADLEPGEYEVAAFDEAGRRATPVRVAVPSREAESLQLLLLPPPRAVGGRIQDAAGVPWLGVVGVTSSGVLGTRWQTVETDTGGAFAVELPLLPEDELHALLDLDGVQLYHPLAAAGGTVWTLPELALVKVRLVPPAGVAPPALLRFRWRRPSEGDSSSLVSPWMRVGQRLRSTPWADMEAQPFATAEVQGSRVHFKPLEGLGYEAPAPPAPSATPGETEIELPLGALELWLQLEPEAEGLPRRELERGVALPADAPGSVLVIEL